MLSLRELTLPHYDLRNHISVEQEHSSIQFRLLLRRRILLTTVTRDYRKHQLCFLAISSLFFTIVCFICRCCLDKLRKNISLHFILFFNMIFWLLPGSRYGSLIAYRMFKYIPIRRFCDDIRLFLCTFWGVDRSSSFSLVSHCRLLFYSSSNGWIIRNYNTLVHVTRGCRNNYLLHITTT